MIQTLKILKVKKLHDDSQHVITSDIFMYYIKACKKLHNLIRTETLT